MLKRLFTPLTLVNQLALIVLLATIIGVAGMAISSRLVHGVQGSAHAINKAGSLRMQSYRLLAAIPLTDSDQKLLDEMTATVFSPELQYAARHDDQQRQLQALQHYWQLECGEVIVYAWMDRRRENSAKPYGTRLEAGQAVSARLVGK